MIPKSGNRFSDKIMRQPKSMIPKSGNRFSDKIMRRPKSMIPKSLPSDLIRGWKPVFGPDHAQGKSHDPETSFGQDGFGKDMVNLRAARCR
jgi:hypothetical protein